MMYTQAINSPRGPALVEEEMSIYDLVRVSLLSSSTAKYVRHSRSTIQAREKASGDRLVFDSFLASPHNSYRLFYANPNIE